jgi:hypothetical protein
VQLAKWANAAGMLPAAILQELASLAKLDILRFELDTKPTLAFQVKVCSALSHLACKALRLGSGHHVARTLQHDATPAKSPAPYGFRSTLQITCPNHTPSPAGDQGV